MRIGILGAGRIGATAARLFARAGHDVALSNSRGPASLTDLVTEINRAVGATRVRATICIAASGNRAPAATSLGAISSIISSSSDVSPTPRAFTFSSR